MTREQEEVIAAARAAGKAWDKPLRFYTPPASDIILAVRALEESEKPKPKVWTCDPNDMMIRCSDGTVLRAEYLRLNDDPRNSVARELVCRALNLLEQSECKPCFEYRCNKCLREAGPCCTCKST